MSIKAVIFDLDGTITRPFFDFDAIREEMGLDRNAGPVLEAMEKMTPQQRQARLSPTGRIPVLLMSLLLILSS